MRTNQVAMMTMALVMALSLVPGSVSAQYVSRPKRPTPPPAATSPQKPMTTTKTTPRLVNGERCGAENAGKAVLIENVSRERMRVTVRDTWFSERGEQRTRDQSFELGGGGKMRVGCTIGNILIEHHSFRVLSY